MKMKIMVAALAVSIATPVAVTFPTTAAFAADRDGRYYNGRGGRYRYRCKRSNGTTGTIAGAVGGGVIGNVLGGGALGTLAGAGGGALLGRTLDKRHDRAQNRRNGC